MYPNIITLNAKKIIPIKSLLLVISIFIILDICAINSYYFLNKFEIFLGDFVEFDISFRWCFGSWLFLLVWTKKFDSVIDSQSSIKKIGGRALNPTLQNIPLPLEQR